MSAIRKMSNLKQLYLQLRKTVLQIRTDVEQKK